MLLTRGRQCVWACLMSTHTPGSSKDVIHTGLSWGYGRLMRTGWELHAALCRIMRRFDSSGWCLLEVTQSEFWSRTWVWQDDRKPHMNLSHLFSDDTSTGHPQFNGHLTYTAVHTEVAEIGSSDWLILAIYVTWRINWKLQKSNTLKTVTGWSQKHQKGFASDYWVIEMNQHWTDWTV